jgi:hypothetical protein
VIAKTWSGCDVVACHEPAIGAYLDARQHPETKFAICAVHFERLTRGEQPVIVAERLDLAELDGRSVLIMESA